MRPGLQKTAGQREALILGNGPSLRGRPWGQVPRDRVFVIGVNQSWREVPDADAHFANDFDQFDFDNPVAAGFGGRAYYERLDGLRQAYHTGQWEPRGVRLDKHDALVFSRRPLQKRHRGAHVPAPKLAEDGGVALKVEPGNAGSSAYIALQIAAAHDFEVIWIAGLDMSALKFEGARGYLERQKKTPTSSGAWSNSERHDRLWRCVPADVRARVRVIAPSRTQVLTVVDWPWGAAGEGRAA